MKKGYLLFLGFLFTLQLTASSVVIDNAQVIPGNTIQLNGIVQSLKIFAITSLNTPVRLEYQIEGQGGGEVGLVTLPEDTRLIVVSNNIDEEVLRIPAVNEDGSAIIGSKLALAQSHLQYAGLMGVSADAAIGKEYLEAAVELESDFLKAYPKHARDVAYQAKDSESKSAVMGLLSLAQSVKVSKKTKESDLEFAFYVLNILENGEALQKFTAKANKQNPDGVVAFAQLQNKFAQTRKPGDLLALYQEADQRFSSRSDYQEAIGNWAPMVAFVAADKSDWETFNTVKALSNSPERMVNYMNSLAWRMIDGLGSPAKDLEKGIPLAEEAVFILEEEMYTAAHMPSYQTKEEYRNQMNYMYSMILDTYAVGLFKNGEHQDALASSLKSIEVAKFKNQSLNTTYATMMLETDQSEEAVGFMVERLKKGQGDDDMRRLLEQELLKASSSEITPRFIQLLDEMALEAYKEEVLAKMISEDAPQFTLTNLEGEEVSLASLKGKTVILDFWATWCGPCKMSFPGMVEAQEKFRDQDVVFLFINTWEGDGDRAEKAGKFIEDKGYPFNVPMDMDDAVVKSYGVSGIPTKFVVGPNGNIRYKSVGYSGDNKKMIFELETVIGAISEDSIANPSASK